MVFRLAANSAGAVSNAMTEPRKFQKGKHSYTRWGPNFKEVRVERKTESAKPGKPAEPASLEIDSATETGVYANMAALHVSDEEVICDFAFLAPRSNRGRVRSRVVVSHHHLHQLAEVMKKTSDQIKAREHRK